MPVYLNEDGEPMSAPRTAPSPTRKAYLDEDGKPVGPPAPPRSFASHAWEELNRPYESVVRAGREASEVYGFGDPSKDPGRPLGPFSGRTAALIRGAGAGFVEDAVPQLATPLNLALSVVGPAGRAARDLGKLGRGAYRTVRGAEILTGGVAGAEGARAVGEGLTEGDYRKAAMGAAQLAGGAAAALPQRPRVGKAQPPRLAEASTAQAGPPRPGRAPKKRLDALPGGENVRLSPRAAEIARELGLEAPAAPAAPKAPPRPTPKQMQENVRRAEEARRVGRAFPEQPVRRIAGDEPPVRPAQSDDPAFFVEEEQPFYVPPDQVQPFRPPGPRPDAPVGESPFFVEEKPAAQAIVGEKEPLARVPAELQPRAQQLSRQLASRMAETGRFDEATFAGSLGDDLAPHAEALKSQVVQEAVALIDGKDFLEQLRNTHGDGGPDGVTIMRTSRPDSYHVVQRAGGKIVGGASAYNDTLTMVAGGRAMGSPVSVRPVYEALDSAGAKRNDVLTVLGARARRTKEARGGGRGAEGLRGETQGANRRPEPGRTPEGGPERALGQARTPPGRPGAHSAEPEPTAGVAPQPEGPYALGQPVGRNKGPIRSRSPHAELLRAAEEFEDGRPLPPGRTPTLPPSEGGGAPRVPGGSGRNWYRQWVARPLIPFRNAVSQIPDVGRQARAKIDGFISAHEDLSSAYAHRYLKTVSRLTPDEWAATQHALEGEAPASPKVAAATQEIRRIGDELAAKAGDADVFIGYRENHFPHKFQDGSWADFGGEAATMERTPGPTSRRAGHLERERLSERGDYRRDAGVYLDYILESTKRIAQAEHLGKRFEKVPRPSNPADARYLETGLVRMSGNEPATQAHAISQGVRSFEAATKLGFSPVRQTGGFPAIFSVGGTKALRALGESFADAMRARAGDKVSKMGSVELDAVRSGAIIGNLADEAQALAGVASKIPWARASQGVDRFMRVVADRTARHLVPELIERGRRGDRAALADLGRLGISPDAPLTPETLDQAGRALSNLTQGRADVARVPLWATSPAGRVATQFMHTMYAVTGAVHNTAQRAAQGDLRPLAKYLAAAAVTGELGNDLIAAAKGYGIRGEDPEGWLDVFKSKRISWEHPLQRMAQNVVFSGLGIYQTIFERFIQSRDVADALGPGVSDVGKLVNAGFEAREKGLGPAAANLGRAAIETTIPFGLGRQISSEFLNEERPQVPGWVGRARDVAEGKTPPREALKAGLLTGGPGTIDRERIQQLERLREETKKRKTELEGQYPRLAERDERTTEEKIGRETKTQKRQAYVSEIMAALAAGQRAKARMLVRRALRRDRIRIDLADLEEAAR